MLVSKDAEDLVVVRLSVLASVFDFLGSGSRSLPSENFLVEPVHGLGENGTFVSRSRREQLSSTYVREDVVSVGSERADAADRVRGGRNV